METVALIPGSWEELFGQGHSRSELVGFYWKKASVCSAVFFLIFHFLFPGSLFAEDEDEDGDVTQRYSVKKSHVG